MQETIALRCSNCGAGATAKPVDDTLKCEYCGTVSLIQRRKGYFERAQKVEQLDVPARRNMPVVTERRSMLWPLKASLPGILFILPILVFIVGGPFHMLLKWQGEAVPILHDVNGDGVADVIGRVERGTTVFEDFAPEVRVAAVDGVSGEVLWQSEVLTRVDWNLGYEVPGILAMSDGVVVFAYEDLGDFEGTIVGWDATTGDLLWTGEGLGVENIESVCGRAGALSFDGRSRDRYVLDLATGGITREEPDESPCGVVASETTVVEVDIPDDTLFAIWQTRGGGEGWDEPAVSDRLVFATLVKDGISFLEAYSLSDGRRLWQSELGDWEVDAIGYATDRVYVTGYRRLRVFDAADGEEQIAIGPLVW